MGTNQQRNNPKHEEQVLALKEIILKLGLDLDPDVVTNALNDTIEEMYHSGKTTTEIAEALLKLLMIAKMAPEKLMTLIAMRASKVQIFDQYKNFVKEGADEGDSS